MRLVRVAAVLATCAATTASAQSLAGTVIDSATRQPIVGAVITLLDSTGRVLGRLLTTERGGYHVQQAAPVRRLRLQRIGYRLREVRVPASTESVIRLDIRLVALPSLLDPVETMSSSQCPKRADGPKAFSLLEQARAALLNTIVAREQNPGRMVRLQYQRLRDGNNIIRQQVRVDSVETGKVSFKAVRSGADFVRLGFMEGEGEGQRFYGPDAEVMLDDGFAAGYCFRIADRDREHPNQVGLAFSAADRKHGRVDLDGTVWIDTVARSLRSIEYKYVGLPEGIRGRAEGLTAFHEVSNGVVFIDRWFISMPEQQLEPKAGVVNVWWGKSESGGEVARASWPDGASWRDSLGSLSMRAINHDSSSATGTVVRLDDTDYIGVADEHGRIRIADLLPGPYKAVLIDTLLASIHVIPAPFYAFNAVRDSTESITFTVKTAGDYTWERCVAGKPAATENKILLLGKIEDMGGHAVHNALIEFAAVGGERLTTYKTGTDGVFSLCLPASARGQAVAVWFKDADGKKRNVVVTLTKELTTLLINIDGR